MGPVKPGQKLPLAWVENASKALKAKYASGYKMVRPPWSQEYKEAARKKQLELWSNEEYRAQRIKKFQDATPANISEIRSDNAKKMWADPVYRAKSIEVRKGNQFAKGYVCTDAQRLNRQRAARISNMRRNYGILWVQEYLKRYPEHSEDVNGYE